MTAPNSNPGAQGAISSPTADGAVTPQPAPGFCHCGSPTAFALSSAEVLVHTPTACYFEDVA